ncbi:MAG: PAS domain S-box protein [Cytophagales bacterium]|nr:MAG: PAS domain S-box protein [Cytophagales bacterium]
MQQPAPSDPLYFLPRTGEMAGLVRERDWSDTPLGPPVNWPQSLRMLVHMMLTTRFPMLIFWGPELITLYNDAFRPSLGDNGKHPSMLGQRGEDAWAEVWPVVGPMIHAIMDGSEAVWFEDQYLPIYREGKLSNAYWTYSYSPLLNDDGAVGGVLVTGSETTEQVLARQKAEESEIRFQSMAEDSDILIAVSNEAGQSTYLNRAWAELTGRSVTDLMDRGWVDLVHPDDREPFLNLYMSALSRQESFSGEFRILDRHGAYRWLWVKCPARFRPGSNGSTGTFAGYISSAIDITDRKQAEEALQTSETRLRSIITNASAAIGLFVGRNLIIELPNQPFIDIVGKGPDIAGKPLREVMPELATENQPFLHILDTVYTSGQPFHTFGSLVKIEREGVMTEGYYNIAYTPLRDVHDEVFAVLEIAIDVTEQIVAQQQLKASEAEYRQLATELEERVRQRTRDLERSNLDLMQFASVASHDLKEPLRKVQTFGTRLQEMLVDRLSEEETDLFRRMVGATIRMQTLITDVLRLSKFSDQTIDFEPVDLNAVVAQIRDDLELTIREQGAEVIADHLPTIQAIPGQMHQLLLNLISNGLKFQNGGVPQVRLYPVPVTDELVGQLGLPTPNYVVMAVSDNGIGFDPKYTDRIFGMFQRLHGKNQYVGTGIGLTIVKKIVENHGGTIDVQSEPGRGSTFRVALPVKRGV